MRRVAGILRQLDARSALEASRDQVLNTDRATADPRLYDPSLAELRRQLAAAYRVLFERRINTFPYNHLTVDCGGGRFLVNRYGLSWSEVTAENLLLVTGEGELLEGEPPVMRAAFVIHQAIHAAKGQSGRVVFHTHQTAATALCCTGGNPMLPPITPAIARFREQYAVVDDRVYCGIANDAKEGQRIVKALGDADVLFMGNHGITLCAPTVAEAVLGVLWLEELSCQAIAVMSGGGSDSNTVVWSRDQAEDFFVEQQRAAPPAVGSGSRQNYWSGRGPFLPIDADPRIDVAVAARALSRLGFVQARGSAVLSVATHAGALRVQGDFSKACVAAVQAAGANSEQSALAGRLHAALGAAAKVVLVAPLAGPLSKLQRRAGKALLPISQDAMLMANHVVFVAPGERQGALEAAALDTQTRVALDGEQVVVRGNSAGHVLGLYERLQKAAEIQLLAMDCGQQLRSVLPEVIAQPRNAFLCQTEDEYPHTLQLQLEWYKRMLVACDPQLLEDV